MNEDKLTIMLHVQQGQLHHTYYVTNMPAWYELLALFSLYSIIAMTIFYSGLWIAGRCK